MAFKIDYVASWAERLRKLLYVQFRDAVTWNQWVDLVLAPQFQELEEAAQALLTLFLIDDSEGVQLDILGRIIGQPRNSGTDAVYRIYLRTRILANLSTGTPEDLYRVFNALLGAIGFVVTTSPIKSFTVRVIGVITGELALIAKDFLTDAKEAGARGLFVWQESPSAAVFTCDIGPGFDDGVFIGALQA